MTNESKEHQELKNALAEKRELYAEAKRRYDVKQSELIAIEDEMVFFREEILKANDALLKYEASRVNAGMSDDEDRDKEIERFRGELPRYMEMLEQQEKAKLESKAG